MIPRCLRLHSADPRTSIIRKTSSAVVKFDDPELSGKAIAEKVRAMVAPSLGDKTVDRHRGHIVCSRTHARYTALSELWPRPSCGHRARSPSQEIGVNVRVVAGAGDGMEVLPEGMRMFTDRRGNQTIIVDHQDAICMPVETQTTDCGVCPVVKGSFGFIFLCSAYCRFYAPLEP